MALQGRRFAQEKVALLVILLFLAPCVGLATTIRTAGPFTVTFYHNGETDGSGTTGQQDWTLQQMDDIAACINIWASSVINSAGRQVDMHCFWYNFSGGILGGSYNSYVGNGSDAWTFTEYVWREGVNYTRPGGYYYDTKIVYDTDAAGWGWNFGTGDPGPTQIDFRSVITHEIGHSVGFIGTYSSGSDAWWSGGITAWDSWLRDDAGNRPSPGSSGTPGNFNQVDNPVWFVGPNAQAANGGNPVAVYAPTTYTAGSSLTHLNEGTFPNYLMSPSISLGEVERSPSAIEWGVIEDIGWQLVPEPDTSLMLSASFAAMASFRRHRPRVARAG